MIRLPEGFDLSLFIGELVPFGLMMITVALSFTVFGIIIKALNGAK